MQVAHFNGSIRDSQAQAAVKPAASNGAKSASTPVAKPEQAAKPKTPAPAAGQVGGKVSAAATIVVKTPPQVAAQARAAEAAVAETEQAQVRALKSYQQAVDLVTDQIDAIAKIQDRQPVLGVDFSA